MSPKAVFLVMLKLNQARLCSSRFPPPVRNLFISIQLTQTTDVIKHLLTTTVRLLDEHKLKFFKLITVAQTYFSTVFPVCFSGNTKILSAIKKRLSLGIRTKGPEPLGFYSNSGPSFRASGPIFVHASYF